MKTNTELQARTSEKSSKPNWFRIFSNFNISKTDKSFFMLKSKNSDIRKRAADFIEKHRTAFESLSKR